MPLPHSFLAEMERLEAEELLPRLLHGEGIIEQRSLLEVFLKRRGETIPCERALNEAVIAQGTIARLIGLDASINGKPLTQYYADGLIIATPTGSTAYALSGGGPILHPSVDAVALVPMFPHKLSSRPIVVQSHSQIDILISANNDMSPYVSCDGLNKKVILPGSRLRVTRHEKILTLIHPTEYSYFTTLREKLGWETHHP